MSNRRLIDTDFFPKNVEFRKSVKIVQELSPEESEDWASIVDTLPLTDTEKESLKSLRLSELISLTDIMPLKDLHKCEVIRHAGRSYILSPFPVGTGGFGTVYKAFDLKLARSVAIKTFIGDDTSKTQLLSREAQAHANEEHPNIARVFDFIEQADDVTLQRLRGKPLLIMEYFDPTDSYSLEDLRTPRPEIIVKIVDQICSALRFMTSPRPRPLLFLMPIVRMWSKDSRPLFHSDLKPQNMFLDRQGNVKITDFGIASTVHNHRKGEINGTAEYMSPEVLRRKSRDVRSELFSLTTIIYRILTGVPFFGSQSSDVIDILTEVLTKKFDPQDPLVTKYCTDHQLNIDAVMSFFDTAWQENPDNRYQTPEDYAQAFRKAFTPQK